MVATYVDRAVAGLSAALASPLVAVTFLTVLPVPTTRGVRDGVFGRAVAYFPLVGTVIGALVAALDAGLSLALPHSVVTALDLAIFVLLTGGLHLDGLMDSCDGLFGGRDRERRLAIMRDSRVGSFGVLGGVLVLLLEFAALATLTGGVRASALVLAPTLGRWAMALCVWAFPYARTEGRGTAFKAGLRGHHTAMATAWAVLAVIVLDTRSLMLLPVVGLLALALGRWIRAKLGGLTGDSYGAVNELVTAATFVVLSGRWS